MDWKIQVESPQEAATLQQFDEDGFIAWDRRLTERNPFIIGRNQMISEKQVQWGHVPGVNTGNGQIEGTMAVDLFLALGSEHGPFQGDPDWFKDDKKFYSFLRKHPELDARPGKHRSQRSKFSKRGLVQ